MNHPKYDASARVKRWALIVWPAFITACLLEAFVFSMIDPSELHWSSYVLELSRQGVYTTAFFCFWLICMVCSGLTWWLARSDKAIYSQDLL